MISQLLQFREIESKKITLNPQQGDLIKYILDIFALFEPYAEKKFITVSTSVFNESVIVYFDYDIIEKILFNLVSNAIKYSPEGEYVYLKIEKLTKEEIESIEKLPLERSNTEYISIKIINTGIDINEDNKQKLFKSFSKLSDTIPVFESRTGLGLSIVKELVETLNGLIILESENKRVSFRIVIPFSKVKDVESEVKTFSYEYTLSELKNMDVDIKNHY
jgi:signal transduction histidine kinase